VNDDREIETRSAGAVRAKMTVRGAVQGVGFRPFVYRLATELDLRGWVLNSVHGVFIEVEGERDAVEQFLHRLVPEKPPPAFIQSLESSILDPVGHGPFEIRSGDGAGKKSALILPDIATCPDCLSEIFDPANRRYRYPFTNCTNCGPRFSVIEALPYDRPNTSMKRFAMCPECEREYHGPPDRRFHAQPTACPACGPQLALWDETGRTVATHDGALRRAAGTVRDGRILAIKGIGGFQLLVDARNEAAVRRLRERKQREEKPFALMVPSPDWASESCALSAVEERLLRSPAAPIVLLDRLKPAGDASAPVAPAVAPNNPTLGVMLPYSPLHHLLMGELGFAVVATSGNLSDEPICIDEHEALERLAGIADQFLVHDRPIVRPIDDSVARAVLGREQILRRARGYAPLPVHVNGPLPAVLAVGAHLKNAVALSVGTEIFISQHIGDLETEPAYSAFRRVAADLPRLYDRVPELVACDLHPEYLSTKFAAECAADRVAVQHHYAHVLACMAENELDPPVLGVSWDGTGLGADGTIWGGEFLLVDESSFSRVAHLRAFRLPGGEEAIKQPRRVALGALFELFGEALFSDPGAVPLRYFADGELPPLRQMLARGLNAPLASSAGRLFDAAASLAGVRQRLAFEGQAAMELEFSIVRGIEASYPFHLGDSDPIVVDWGPTLRAILSDAAAGEAAGVIAAKFHNALAAMIVAVARRIGEPRVALTGGCFQNRYLTERAVRLLENAGFRPSWHQRVPPNDGGIALGQVVAATRSAKPADAFLA
jgi:hydrogenase maturation protein HypF